MDLGRLYVVADMDLDDDDEACESALGNVVEFPNGKAKAEAALQLAEQLAKPLAAIAELRCFNQWVAWKYVQRGEGKPTKPPISPHIGRKASITTPADWSSYEKACRRRDMQKLPGVGFVLTATDPFIGIDLDGCRNKETGVIDSWAQELLDNAETYCEVSPSGTGIRMIAEGEQGKAFKCNEAGVEVYFAQRYLTITERHIPGTPEGICEAPKTLAALLARVEAMRPKEAVTSDEENHQKHKELLRVSGGDVRRGESLKRRLLSIRERQGVRQHRIWVTSLFPKAKRQPGTGGWRVSSRDLGRHLQEDLSITSIGAVDFGVADMGDANLGKRTAIDLVIEWGGASDATAAALWLCERLGVDPASLGWQENTDDDHELLEIGNKLIEGNRRKREAEQEADDAQDGKDKAGDSYHRRPKGGVSLDDFYAYMPMHNFIYAPIRETWPGSSVDLRIPPVRLTKKNGEPLEDEAGNQKQLKATAWLDRHRPVEQMTWAPGELMIIRNRLMANGGWIKKQGVSCFNLYLPPTLKHGSAADAGMWLDHVRRVYGDDAEHIIHWLAHRVQRPQEKINHALVLGGNQGVGKDTLLEPVKRAIGPWNFQEVSPPQVIGRFNGFLKSVILRISEARDLGDTDRYKFYDHMKAYTAAPPDVLRVDEKHLREHSILNCCGVIITTNYKADGIYLPDDDRRHYVAWTNLSKDDFTEEYWSDLWGWYESGGIQNVAAYLASLDLSTFNPKAPPPKTQAFWEIVDASCAPEDAELADVIDAMGAPDALTIDGIAARTDNEELCGWLNDRKSRRVIRHRLEACGYTPVRNTDAKDGLWKLYGKRQAVYAKKDISQWDRLAAARELAGRRSFSGPGR